MTHVYLHASLAREPDVRDQLGHLAGDGHALFLLGPWPADAVEAVPAASSLAELPAEPPRGSWLLTADITACEERRPGLQTMLVGPRAAGPPAAPRCDVEARDLATAVLELMAKEAMG